MGLSIAEKLLLDGLRIFHVHRGNAMLIMLLLKTDEMRWDLMNYMVAHQEATEDELVSLARSISSEKSEELPYHFEKRDNSYE